MTTLLAMLVQLLCRITGLSYLHRRYWAYIDKITESGYCKPINPRILATARVVARVLLFFKFGKVNIVGQENLNEDEYIVLVFNHQSLWDTLVYLAGTKEAYYGPAAKEVIRKCWGLPALIMVQGGAISLDRSNGSSLKKPLLNAFKRVKRIGFAPEAKINRGGMGPFKPGFANFAIELYEMLKSIDSTVNPKVCVQPGYMRYHKPEHKNFVQYLISLRKRIGVTMKFLPPVYYNPEKHKTTEHLVHIVRKQMVAEEEKTK